MTARTIVGSGPRRRPLPLGREAVERAIRLCKFHGVDWPALACAHIYGLRIDALGYENMRASAPVDYLPVDLRHESVDELRERLRGYP
jgi:hypothetical protein